MLSSTRPWLCPGCFWFHRPEARELRPKRKHQPLRTWGGSLAMAQEQRQPPQCTRSWKICREGPIAVLDFGLKAPVATCRGTLITYIRWETAAGCRIADQADQAILHSRVGTWRLSSETRESTKPSAVGMIWGAPALPLLLSPLCLGDDWLFQELTAQDRVLAVPRPFCIVLVFHKLLRRRLARLLTKGVALAERAGPRTRRSWLVPGPAANRLPC